MSSRFTPRRRRSGFTLIELLIVVVIIGILAAIAIPKFSTTKGKAYLGAMKSDLRNLAAAQESYAYDYTSYSDDLGLLGFQPSPGVTLVITISGDGWSAESTHPAASPMICQLYVGGAGPMSIATDEGLVACD
jgi:prepilin-type N-terminal cleavage/methylation domain-containing protein